MTIIAFDGTTLAADKCATISSLGITVTKIFRVPQGLLGISGDYARSQHILHWFRKHNGDPQHCPSFQLDNDDYLHLLLIKPPKTKQNPNQLPPNPNKPLKPKNKPTIWKYEYSAYPYQIEDDYYALGSGKDFALAAMYLGQTAHEAVLTACVFDVHCGMGIDLLTL